jgi:predicted phosphodiesterase
VDDVVYCHATPARDDAVVLPQLERSDWSAFTAPLTMCGHTHLQFAIDRIVNPGSVGLPNVRAAAWWALVDDGSVELRTTEYDTVATAEAMRRSSMPEADELADELLNPPTVEQLLARIG